MKSSTSSITIRDREVPGDHYSTRDGREIFSYQADLAEGWTIRLDCTAEKWSGSIWRMGTCYECLWPLYGSGPGEIVRGADTPEEIIAKAEDMLRPRDLGSLDPRDVGFDLRATQTAIVLPFGALQVTIRVPSRKSKEGRIVTGTSERVAADLRGSGYRVAICKEVAC